MLDYPILYSSRKDGKTQAWFIRQDGGRYQVITGHWDGTQIISSSEVTSEWKEAYPTNVGRSNERMHEAQAKFEIEALYLRRREQGAVYKIGDEPLVPNQIKPMLAKEFDKKKIKFPVFTQPKLDGVRCIVTKDGMFSRAGKLIVSAPHIHEDLIPLLDLGYVFDGELYAHHLKSDFEKIISLARKSKPTEEDLAESAEHLQYWIYDTILDMDFADRFEVLKTLDFPESCILVRTDEVSSIEEMDSIYGENIADGYEGQMVRRNARYQFSRTADLQKRKEFLDEEFEILDIEEGQGNWSGVGKVIVCRLNKPSGILKDDVFRATLKGTREYARQILIDKELYIGGKASVRFQNYSVYNVPRFPVAVAVFQGERDI